MVQPFFRLIALLRPSGCTSGRPKTIKTDKAIATSRPIVAARCAHLTTLRYTPLPLTTLGQPCHIERSGVEISNHIAAVVDSSASLRFAQNDSELIPPRPLRRRCRVVSAAITMVSMVTMVFNCLRKQNIFNSSSRRIASAYFADTPPRSMQFCGDLPLLMRPC